MSFSLQQLKNKKLQHTAVYLFSVVLQKGLPFLVLPIITHLIPPTQYGLWSLFTVMITFTVPCSGMSLGSYRRFEQTGCVDFVSLLQVAQTLRIDNEVAALFDRKSYQSLDEVEQRTKSEKKGRVRVSTAKRT